MVNSHVLKVSETNTTSLQGINAHFLVKNAYKKLTTYKCCDFRVVDFGPKTAFLTQNSAFFYATPMKPPFFGSDGPDSMG